MLPWCLEHVIHWPLTSKKKVSCKQMWANLRNGNLFTMVLHALNSHWVYIIKREIWGFWSTCMYIYGTSTSIVHSNRNHRSQKQSYFCPNGVNISWLDESRLKLSILSLVLIFDVKQLKSMMSNSSLRTTVKTDRESLSHIRFCLPFVWLLQGNYEH